MAKKSTIGRTSMDLTPKNNNDLNSMFLNSRLMNREDDPIGRFLTDMAYRFLDPNFRDLTIVQQNVIINTLIESSVLSNVEKNEVEMPIKESPVEFFYGLLKKEDNEIS